MTDSLSHIGTETSGRYPKGSGKDPEQRYESATFVGEVNKLRKEGMSDEQIYTGFGMNSQEFRQRYSILNDERKIAEAQQAWKLSEKGYSPTKIGEIMGKNESSIRSMLEPGKKDRLNLTRSVANKLKEEMDKDGAYLDVGVQTERFMGVSRTRLKTALLLLKDEGYEVHSFPEIQVGTGKPTTMMVVAKPGTTWADVVKNKENIRMVEDHYSDDGGHSFFGLEPPTSISSKRIKVNYADDGSGGQDKDGVIELRRGVDDISLGDKKYAQVRIAVDGTHFLKGMAIYSDDMPPGVDIMYNTNKSKAVPPEKVFKPMKVNKETGEIDMDNPFGSTIKANGQKHYIDPKTGKDKLSALNVVSEEGDWDTWSKTLSSQMLSKQTPALAEKQLKLAYDDKKKEFDEILSLTNPAVRKKLLEGFADEADSDAVHLKAAALPRQSSRIILPVPSMKDTEIYAPTYNNGEKVALIRYPHGGKFEIPELTVNNQQPVAKKLFGKLEDAVGISPKVAERLSGADFDGDTVLVIPNRNASGKQIIQTRPALEGLKDFDPKALYKLPETAPKMTSRQKGIQMGNVSNLITDMTIRGANDDELARAVKHSMVVIDAEKHHLNYKQSAIDNRISELKKAYQGGATRGASTLISRASSDKRVDDRVAGTGNGILNPKTGKEKRIYIDPATGKKLYTPTGKSYVKKTVQIQDEVTGKKRTVSASSVEGKKALASNPNLPIKETVIKKTIKSTKMAETDDAFTLSSGLPMETIYATHANKLKALANEARKEYIVTPPAKWNPSASKTYAAEVISLKGKLDISLRNAPLERNAQRIANSQMRLKRQANPEADDDTIKKWKTQTLREARYRMGADKTLVDLTDREWEAIQAGAVSNNTLVSILNNADPAKIRTLATPREKPILSAAKEQRIMNLIKSGHTQAEIANEIGISTSAVSAYMRT